MAAPQVPSAHPLSGPGGPAQDIPAGRGENKTEEVKRGGTANRQQGIRGFRTRGRGLGPFFVVVTTGVSGVTGDFISCHDRVGQLNGLSVFWDRKKKKGGGDYHARH